MQTIQTITTKSSRLRRGFYWASRYSRSVILLNRSLRLFLPKYSSVNSNYSLDGRVSFRFIGSFQSPDSGFWGSSVSKEGRTRSEKELLIWILLKPFTCAYLTDFIHANELNANLITSFYDLQLCRAVPAKSLRAISQRSYDVIDHASRHVISRTLVGRLV